MITCRRIAIQALVANIVMIAAASHAGDMASINVRGQVIKINDTTDDVFEVLKESDLVNQKVQKDPNNPNSLLVVKNFNVNGKSFTLYLARVADPGPYRVIKITED